MLASWSVDHFKVDDRSLRSAFIFIYLSICKDAVKNCFLDFIHVNAIDCAIAHLLIVASTGSVGSTNYI